MNKYFDRIHGVIAILSIIIYIAAFIYSTIILIQKSIYESGWYLWGLFALFFITGYLMAFYKVNKE